MEQSAQSPQDYPRNSRPSQEVIEAARAQAMRLVVRGNRTTTASTSSFERHDDLNLTKEKANGITRAWPRSLPMRLGTALLVISTGLLPAAGVGLVNVGAGFTLPKLPKWVIPMSALLGLLVWLLPELVKKASISYERRLEVQMKHTRMFLEQERASVVRQLESEPHETLHIVSGHARKRSTEV
jgi:hypothetical protein